MLAGSDLRWARPMPPALAAVALLMAAQLCLGCANVPAKPLIVGDGSGGAIVARIQRERLHVARMSGEGKLSWQTALTGGRTTSAMLLEDGSGGAIAVWMATGPQGPRDEPIYAQRLSAAGEALWSEGGVPVCVAPGHQALRSIARDGSGGVIVVWLDLHSDPHGLYVQRLDASGRQVFGSGGARIAVTTTCGEASATSDELGGVIIAWEGRQGDVPALYAQRLGSEGLPIWQADGMLLAKGLGIHAAANLRAVADGQGGAVVAWQGNPSGELRVQRVSAEGECLWEDTPLWPGQPLEGERLREDPVLSGDINEMAHLLLQKMRSADATLENEDPLSVWALGADMYEVQIVEDGAGGAILVWRAGQVPTKGGSIRAQRLDAVGNPTWPVEGVPVYPRTSGYQGYPHIAGDGMGGVVIVFLAGNSASDARAYAQRVGPGGDLLWPEGAVRVLR